MDGNYRFNDENLTLDSFYANVDVVCSICNRRASARVDFDRHTARLLCTHCGYSKELSTKIGKYGSLQMAAHMFFNATLWLQAPFKNDTVYAYNDKHLAYLECYIQATLREHKDRTHFTLLEKLPKFYHEAKNRTALLKIIAKLKKK